MRSACQPQSLGVLTANRYPHAFSFTAWCSCWRWLRLPVRASRRSNWTRRRMRRRSLTRRRTSRWSRSPRRRSCGCRRKRAACMSCRFRRREAFAADTTRTFGQLRRSVFVPPQPLPPGHWFWRYGIETKTGPVFGRPRPFTIPADARPFPFPDWDQVVQRCVPRAAAAAVLSRPAAGASPPVGRRRVEAGDRLPGGRLRTGSRPGVGGRAGRRPRGVRTTGRGPST